MDAKRALLLFSHTDLDLLRARAALSPGRRLQAMLDARALIAGMIRGRLRQQFPTLSAQEINMKLLEEFERAKSLESRPAPLSEYPLQA